MDYLSDFDVSEGVKLNCSHYVHHRKSEEIVDHMEEFMLKVGAI